MSKRQGKKKTSEQSIRRQNISKSTLDFILCWLSTAGCGAPLKCGLYFQLGTLKKTSKDTLDQGDSQLHYELSCSADKADNCGLPD